MSKLKAYSEPQLTQEHSGSNREEKKLTTVNDVVEMIIGNVNDLQHRFIVDEEFKDGTTKRLFRGEIEGLSKDTEWLGREVVSLGVDINEERETDWTHVIGVTVAGKIDRVRIFEKELGLIRSSVLRKLTTFCLERVPEYFFLAPASSSGKYHPPFSQGEGGLVRHTKAAVAWYVELMRMTDKEPEDAGIVACILHDSFKKGLEGQEGKHTVKNHAEIAADQFEIMVNDFFYQLYLPQNFGLSIDVELVPGLVKHVAGIVADIGGAIRYHMGRWTEPPIPKDYEPTELEKMVHLADYCASRKIGFDPFD